MEYAEVPSQGHVLTSGAKEIEATPSKKKWSVG